MNPTPENWEVRFGVIEEPLLVSCHSEIEEAVQSGTFILYSSALTFPSRPFYAELPVVEFSGGFISNIKEARDEFRQGKHGGKIRGDCRTAVVLASGPSEKAVPEFICSHVPFPSLLRGAASGR